MNGIDDVDKTNRIEKNSEVTCRDTQQQLVELFSYCYDFVINSFN